MIKKKMGSKKNVSKVEDAQIVSETKETPVQEIPKEAIHCRHCEEKVPHMFVAMNKEGKIHVHAPFSNKWIMNEFMEAIIEEQAKFNKSN